MPKIFLFLKVNFTGFDSWTVIFMLRKDVFEIFHLRNESISVIVNQDFEDKKSVHCNGSEYAIDESCCDSLQRNH